jgi:NAD(P)-dependent dehydrogenase (short-subunit alcohol dehydrogenase family)
MDLDLSGRVALVSGASGGIGSVVAEVLAECGADLALSYGRNRGRADEVARHARALGVRARLDQVDATDRLASKAWADAVRREYGKIDIVANCVGSAGGFQLFREQSPDQWRQLIDQHLWAGVYLIHAVLDHMIERGRGRIIMLSSDGAKVGQSGAALGNAGSAGLIGFGKCLAREVARHDITVNAVCPGPTRTPILDRMIAGGDTGAKLAAAAARAIPMKRAGEPREVAAVFAFLASDAASFITGQSISVSGGLTMC